MQLESAHSLSKEGAVAAIPIEQKLEDVRKRLLDLTRANRLLNHKPKGQRTLRIEDEIPEQVYDFLVRQGRAMQFLSREEAPGEIADSLPEEESNSPGEEDSPGAGELGLAPMEDGAVADRHLDSNLQTLVTGEALQTRLVN